MFPVWVGKTSRMVGKGYPVSSGISFPLGRNMQLFVSRLQKGHVYT